MSGKRPRPAWRLVLGVTVATIAFVTLAASAGAAVWYGAMPGRLKVATVRAALAGPRIVAITVDDGPTTSYTPTVLALLRKHRDVATFFVIGRLAQRLPGIVRQEIHQGSTVGVHTWSHPRMDRISEGAVRYQATRGMHAVEAITGRRPLYYRPPRGVLTAAESATVSRLGMHTVLWDVCLDHAADRTPEAAAARVMAHIRPDDIILLHDGGGHREKTMKALAILLRALAAGGYRVVPLARLPL